MTINIYTNLKWYPAKGDYAIQVLTDANIS